MSREGSVLVNVLCVRRAGMASRLSSMVLIDTALGTGGSVYLSGYVLINSATDIGKVLNVGSNVAAAYRLVFSRDLKCWI